MTHTVNKATANYNTRTAKQKYCICSLIIASVSVTAIILFSICVSETKRAQPRE